MNGERSKIYKVTNRILKKFETRLNESPVKADLAHLRNSIGRPLSQTVEVWPIIFEYMPEEYLNDREGLTDEEDAILTAVQLYALYQQSKLVSVLPIQDSEYKYKNIGYSLSHLRTEKDRLPTDRRFNALVTASSYSEFKYHLRQMISLLKAKADVVVDFAKLSEDLYWFKRGYPERIRLSWSKSYYYQRKGENYNDQK